MPELNLDVLEAEHLIGRLKTIELLERESPYRNVPERVDHRFAHAMKAIPAELRTAALATFGSVKYMNRSLLDDAWRYLWTSLDTSVRRLPTLTNIVFLELDRDQIRDDFFRANALAGRLQDNFPWRSAHDITDALMNLEKGELRPELGQELITYLGRELWILLIDISLSGTSAVSEIRRLTTLRSKFFPHAKGRTLALIQVATEDALAAINSEGHEAKAAVHIPRSWALADPQYSIISDPTLVADMRSLCAWMAECHVLKSDYRLSQLARVDPNVGLYGFGGRGWPVVMHRNTPNNSLPVLWFAPPTAAYHPPFERIDSRIGESWNGRREWYARLENDEGLVASISQKLRGYTGSTDDRTT